MSEILLLHLSDIHFKKREKEDNKTVRQEIQKKLLETVASFGQKERKPDFVAITGDIAFSGKAHEYEEAKAFFAQLKALLPVETIFLAVPGNHDVDREKVSELVSLQRFVKDGQADKFLESKEKGMQDFIHVKFNAFRDFCHSLNPGLYPTQADYFWVKDFPGQDVSFLGLNSAWASEGDSDRFNIALGYPQVREALERSGISNRVLLMHHPPINWLNESDFNRYSGEIFKRCGLILHGHTHADNALVVKNPSASCICLGANASYTKEKKGFIGFQFLQLRFLPGGTVVKVWPYRLETRDRFRFIPDTQRWEGQEGPYFELGTIEKISTGKENPVIPLEIPADYRAWIKEFHSSMEIDLLASKGEVIAVSLPEVYIPIETRNPFYKEKLVKKADMIEGFIHHGAPTLEEKESGEPSSIDIEVLVGRKKRILLQGGAGQEKPP